MDRTGDEVEVPEDVEVILVVVVVLVIAEVGLVVILILWAETRTMERPRVMIWEKSMMDDLVEIL